MPGPEPKEEQKFFFEADPESLESGVNWLEQADAFNGVIQGAGAKTQVDSMAPMGVQVEASLKRIQNSWVAVEFGRVKKDYVIHTIPLNPRLDFGNKNVFQAVSRITILLLNEVVPFDLQVNVFPPDSKWSVKAISYKILQGADAWNLDLSQLEEKVIPKLAEDLAKFCIGARAGR